MNKEKLTMIELFSGIGAQIKGTNNTNLFNTNVIATADIEKDAMVSYAAIHNGLTEKAVETYKNYPSEEQMRNELIDKNIGYDFKKGTNPITRMKGNNLKKYYLAMILSNNLGDISKIKELPLADFWTYSFPCQDISVAGKQSGIIKGETRSGLLYEVERLLIKANKTNTLPKYLLLENVKNLVGKQFIEQFNDWIKTLDELGYNTYWEVTNAKNCGIPQNRERTFALSIRKDIDTKMFEFMKPFDLGYRLRDFLEDVVDDKYYLSQEIQDRLQITDDTFTKNIVGTTKPDFRTIGQRDLVYQKDSIMGTLVATDYKQPKQIIEDCGDNDLKIVGSLKGVMPQFDNSFATIANIYSNKSICPTLDTMQGGNRQPKVVIEEEQYRVRKLTPKECWRLMGFSDEDYEKALSMELSDSAGYKQAGNSIVTTCIELIMEHLYKAQYNNTYICTDEKILNGELKDINFTQPQAV